MLQAGTVPGLGRARQAGPRPPALPSTPPAYCIASSTCIEAVRAAHSRQYRASVCTGGIARDILTAQAAQLEGDPLAFLQVTEAYWKTLKASKNEPNRKGPTVVRVAPVGSKLEHTDYDVVVCGGTLGLMLATTLQRRGHKVAVVDKRLIQGRTQEWNISRGELEALTRAGLLTKAELESCVASEFNPVRVGFAGGPQLWVNDCLNLGVSPRKLLDLIKDKFVEAGGTLMENVSFKSAEVMPGSGVRITLNVHAAGQSSAPLSLTDVNRPNGLGGNSSNNLPPFTMPESSGASLSSADGASAAAASTSSMAASEDAAGKKVYSATSSMDGVEYETLEGLGMRPGRTLLRARLLLDCMGHYSDIVKQMRGRAKPDGMCLVVGSCAEGFSQDNNDFGDLLYTIDDAKDDLQMFWEAFPAEGGKARTTYMFAYSDAEPQRPSFETLLDRYFEGLAAYQGVPAHELRFKRVLFGGFPCWSNGPLQPQWDHIMQIGDASASQSPLSFGGFGAMLRHLGRLTEGLDDALRCGALSRSELAWMHPYQPSLSASWLFQRSMSVGVGQLASAAPAATSVPAGLQAQLSHAGTASTSASQLSSSSTAALQNGSGAAAGSNGSLVASQPAQPVPTVAVEPAPAGFSFPPRLSFPADHVNQVLACNFGVMQTLGDRVVRPFLQDTIQFLPLTLSMAGMMFANPVAISRVLLQVGPRILSGWFVHYLALLSYTALHFVTTPVRTLVRSAAGVSTNILPAGVSPLDVPPQQRMTSSRGRSRNGFGLRRFFDMLEYGSSEDYDYHPSSQPPMPPKVLSFNHKASAMLEGASEGSGGWQAHGDGQGVAAAASTSVGSGVPAPARQYAMPAASAGLHGSGGGARPATVATRALPQQQAQQTSQQQQ